MNLKETLKELESLSDEKTKRYNLKNGVGENQYGVKLGDIRKVAKKIKTNQKLALELWKTKNFDAQMLATLIMKAKEFTANEIDEMICSIEYPRLADWFNAYIVKEHPENEKLRQKWMKSKNPMAARGGWNLTSILVRKNPDILEIPHLLDRLDKEMGSASEVEQWTMNFTLAEIGINHPAHRKKALEIGEKFGIYKDYPVAKGCVSPYAPIWINEMVSRQK